MFNVKLEENAQTAFLSAADSLANILDGEGTYKNFRSYVINLHSSLELFLKKMLFDHNDFMLFSFNKYDNLIEKFKKAHMAHQTIFEYVVTNNAKLPNTVTFTDAIYRLAYLYRDTEFTVDYICKLEALNSLRNNIVHFELDMEDDQLVLLNDLFIITSAYYLESCFFEHELPINIETIKNKNMTIREAIVSDPFNKKLLEILNSESGWEDSFDFEDLADSFIECGSFNESETEKIVKRLNVFENAGLIEHNSYSGEHYDVGWYYLSKTCTDLLDKT